MAVTWWGESTRHQADPANCVTVGTRLFPLLPSNGWIGRSTDRSQMESRIADHASLRSPHWVVLMDRYLRGWCTLKECAPIAGRSPRDQIYLAAKRHASTRPFAPRSSRYFLCFDLSQGGDFLLWSRFFLAISRIFQGHKKIWFF